MNIAEYLLNNVPRAGRFFMPGHKGRLSPIDVTETFGTDDLRNPQGIIKEAQERVARVFGAEDTFFLVNGSTLGIQAMIVSCQLSAGSCQEKVQTDCFPKNEEYFFDLRRALHSKKRKIIIDEYCHVSVHNVCALLGLDVITLPRKKMNYWEVELGISSEELGIMEENKDAIGVLITSPTYYGMQSDISGIAEVCHYYDIPLLVDQAHGAHFGFHEELPQNAIADGADLCVQSVHKTLPSLTQTAVLQKNKNSLIDREVVQIALNLFQTTSPSYLFMTSIENAICGDMDFNWLIKKCKEFRAKVDCLENDDITRLVFKGEINELKSKGICAEKADEFRNIVLIPTICNSEEDFELLEGLYC